MIFFFCEGEQRGKTDDGVRKSGLIDQNGRFEDFLYLQEVALSPDLPQSKANNAKDGENREPSNARVDSLCNESNTSMFVSVEIYDKVMSS